LSNQIAEVGDYVEQDEEIATIETDKVRLYQHARFLPPPN